MKAQQTCGYLYADGHAVIIFEQEVSLGGKRTRMEYAVIHEKWTDANLSFKGRIYFSRYESQAMLDLCKRASNISAALPSTENGSENTQARNRRRFAHVRLSRESQASLHFDARSD